MRIAIVGSGIAGMSAAWLLDQAYEVTVYEADSRIGGHSHTIFMPTSKGSMPVDTGFIVYNEPNYPNLTALFHHLEVPTKVSNMSFGVSLDDGRFEYSGSDRYSSLFAQKSNLLRPSFYQLLKDILRFNKDAQAFLETWHRQKVSATSSVTLGEFLDGGRYGERFCAHYLLPMSAAIWSASLEQIRKFPAASFFQFFDNHGLISINDRPTWRTVEGGSTAYVNKLTRPFQDKVRLETGVSRILRRDGAVDVYDEHGGSATYDAVVLACHADQALKMIESPTDEEQSVLGAFDYQENRVVLHSDRGLMPRRRAAWAGWNYLASSHESEDVKVSVTYWLNLLQSLPEDRLALVSLNPMREPDPDTVVAMLNYAHPQFDHKALEAQTRLHEIQGRNKLWFAGAHWGYGFHEDGLLSGLQVAAGLGVKPPWWTNIEPMTAPHGLEPLPSSARKKALVGGQ